MIRHASEVVLPGGGDGLRRSRGFTLIELLVVVAIIGLLIAILLPALSGARKAAQKVNCLANVRSMAQIFTMYSTSQKNWYPTVPPDVSTQPLMENQHVYGGLAGFFSLRQLPQDGTTITLPNGEDFYTAGIKTEAVMETYMQEGAEWGALQCPADLSDGEPSNTVDGVDNPSAATVGFDGNTQKSPYKITRREDVVWYNISYLYVAGLRADEKGTVAMFGDEANSSDLTFAEAASGTLDTRTLRNQATDIKLRGYTEADNHGNKGGNFANSDGSALWIDNTTSQFQPGDQTEPSPWFASGRNPHDQMYYNIAGNRADGVRSIATID